MHLIGISRGINDRHEVWKSFLQSQWFNFYQKPILKNPDGSFQKDKDGNTLYGEPRVARVQGSLRPIMLWEYIFPKDGVALKDGKLSLIPNQGLKEVLAMMQLNDKFPLRPEVANFAWMLRKMIGAKKIPQDVIDDISKKQPYDVTDKMVPMAGTCFYPIGIKEDETHDFDFGHLGGFYQEGL